MNGDEHDRPGPAHAGRPGAVALVQADLEILQNLATRAARAWEFARDVDAVGLVDEFADTIRAELDYLEEGRNAERFARDFEGPRECRHPSRLLGAHHVSSRSRVRPSID